MKQVLRFVIFVAMIFSMCLWSFFIGTAFAGACLILGIFSGVFAGYWEPFFMGCVWIVGHFVWVPFQLLYKKIYGVDDWLENEVPFVF